MLPALLTTLFLSAPIPEGIPLSQPGMDGPTTDWHLGPAHQLLSLKEEEAYRRLKTTEERQRFIEAFWAALDPTPGTPENERRTEFRLRVEQANLLFTDSLRPGWMTDRGVIYLLLGPPDRWKRLPWGDSWSYEAVSSPDSQPALSFAFFRAPGGEYSLIPPAPSQTDRRPKGLGTSQDGFPTPPDRSISRMPGPYVHRYSCPSGGDPPRTPYLSPLPQGRQPPRPAYRAGAAGADNSRFASQMASLQAIPGRIRLAAGASASEYFFGNLQAAPSLRFTRAADAKTHTVLTLAVPSRQLREPGKPIRVPDLILAVSIQETASGKVIARVRQKLTPDPSWQASSGADMRFQTAFDLPPGAYRAEGTVFDERSHQGSLCSIEISVPDFGTSTPEPGVPPPPP